MHHSDTSRELTVRGLVLGALITVVFTASNTYLGLKIGLTFASSIPAAVISMAVLRLMGEEAFSKTTWSRVRLQPPGPSRPSSLCFQP